MANKEPIAWITRGGKHIPIYDKGPTDEEKQKERQISQNQKEADKLNGKQAQALDYEGLKEYYSKFRESQADCAMQLYRRTGINMSGHLGAVDKDTFVETCATLEDLQNRFRINKAGKEGVEASINGRKVDEINLEVHIPSVYEKEFEGDKSDVFAHARLGRIALNQKYYSLPPEEFEAIYEEGTKGWEFYHPQGSTHRGTVAHESAHHMLDQYVWDKYCKGKTDSTEKYNKIQEFLVDTNEYTSMGEKTAPEIKELFGKFDKVRTQYIKKMKKDPDAVKYLGSYLGDKPLRYMANPFNYGHYGISGYSAKNYHELLAEAFQDYYENEKDSKLLSRMLVKEFFGFK